MYPDVLYCDTQISNLKKKGMDERQIAERWFKKFGTLETADHSTDIVRTGSLLQIV
jgi:hypothetical protein